MPLHDWTKVPAGLFHDFHQTWSIAIRNALNAGILPKGLVALVEQKAGSKEGDVLGIETNGSERRTRWAPSSTLTMERPATRIIRQTDRAFYAEKANRIVVTHHLGRIVAIIEIVSPGNKDGVKAIRDFVEKIADSIDRGIHVLVVDLFPPTKRDPVGIHKAIWDQFMEEEFELPEGKDRILVSYEAGATKTAFVEPVGVGDKLPDMPLFVTEGAHVRVPLEATYQSSWTVTPDVVREAVETGILPSFGDEDAEV